MASTERSTAVTYGMILEPIISYCTGPVPCTGVVLFTNPRGEWDPPENNRAPSLNLRPKVQLCWLLPLTLEP